MGQTVESKAPVRVPKEKPTTSRCLAGQTIESKAPVRVPKEKPLRRIGLTRSIQCPKVLSNIWENQVSSSKQCYSQRFAKQSLNTSKQTTSKTITPAVMRNTILKPRSLLHLAAFNVRTLCQIGQQAALACTLETFNIDICCVSETRIQDPTSIITLRSPDPTSNSRYFLRVSGDSAASSRGLAGVGVALSARAEMALLDWIPVSSRLCAFGSTALYGSIAVD